MTIDSRLPAPLPYPGPLSSVTPFTYRDGATYLSLLEELRHTLNAVIEHEAEQNDFLESSIKEQVDKINEIMSQLIGYTIEITEDTYRASMMDGSTFEAYTINGVDNLVNAVETLLTENVERIDNTLSGRINLKSFGAIGDGVADDTAALTEFLDYLGENGGEGFMPAGRYRFTEPLWSMEPDHAYTLSGAGVGETILLHDAPEGNGLNFNNVYGATIRDFSVHGKIHSPNVTSNMSHGITGYNCSDVTVQDVEIRAWNGTAVLFGTTDRFTGTGDRNHFTRVRAIGDGHQNNGLMHNWSDGSTMTDCVVLNLDRGGSPSYALQLKSECTNCTITGGYVDGAAYGVAFGQETDQTHRNNTVTGVTVRNCNVGIGGSLMTGCSVNATVDMNNDPNCYNGVRLGGNARDNNVHVTVINPHTTSTIFNLISTGNDVYLDGITGYDPEVTVASFGPSSQNNTVHIMAGFIHPATAKIVNDGAANNAVSFAGRNAAFAIDSDGQSILPFAAPDNANTWINYSHASDEFFFRVRGTNIVRVSETAFNPSPNEQISLGEPNRRWLEVHARNGMIVRGGDANYYRIGVNANGEVTATQV